MGIPARVCTKLLNDFQGVLGGFRGFHGLPGGFYSVWLMSTREVPRQGSSKYSLFPASGFLIKKTIWHFLIHFVGKWCEALSFNFFPPAINDFPGSNRCWCILRRFGLFCVPELNGPNAECRMPSAEFGLLSPEYQVLSAKCRVRSAESWMLSADCRMPSPMSWVQRFECGVTLQDGECLRWRVIRSTRCLV